MFWQAFWVALWAWWIGSTWTLNLRFFAFMRPLVSGAVVGWILGDPVTGTIVGATINALFIGWIAAGGAMPADITIAGVLGPALAILANMEPEMALAMVIPIAMVGVSIHAVQMSFQSFFCHWADRYAERGYLPGIVYLNVIPSTIFTFFYPGVATFLAVYYGPEAVQDVMGFLPATVVTGLRIAGRILPAVGFAMLLRYMLPKVSLIPLFFVGFLAATYLKLDIVAVVAFGVCAIAWLYSRGLLFPTKEAAK